MILPDAEVKTAIAEQFPATAQTQPELLAHHYTEAGLASQAVPYWQRAGQLAVQRSANLEAGAHLTKGLEVLATLPDTPERAQQELVVQTTLGPALMVTKGYSTPEVLQAYARAHELCQQVGETPQLFQVLRGLWTFYLIRMELRTALELGEQLLTLALQAGDPALLLEAHYALGNTLNYLGEFAAARAHFDQGIALYDPRRHRAHAVRYAQDPSQRFMSGSRRGLTRQTYRKPRGCSKSSSDICRPEDAAKRLLSFSIPSLSKPFGRRRLCRPTLGLCYNTAENFSTETEARYG